MKLNISCVRDILLTVEKYETIYEPVSFDSKKNSHCDDFLSSYNTDEILYHVRYCIYSGVLSDVCGEKPWGCIMFDCCLEPPGHDFLENTRTDEKWHATKTIFSKVGGASLKALSAISEGVTAALINKYLPAEISKIPI